MVDVRTKATYADLLAAPEHKVAELIDGELFVSSRPPPLSLLAATRMSMLIGSKRDPRWWILREPEIHLGDDVVVPDVAAWRRERLPRLPEEHIQLAPDWVCEVRAPTSTRVDRLKIPLYARVGVEHLWRIDPLDRIAEFMQLENGHWMIDKTAWDGDVVRVAPFETIDLELGLLWETVAPVATDPAPAP